MSPRNYEKEYKKEIESVDFLRVRIPRDIKERLRQKAADDGTTISKWILEQITAYIKEPPK